MRNFRLAQTLSALSFLATLGCGGGGGTAKDDCVDGICTKDPGSSTKGGTGGRSGSGGGTTGGDPGTDGGTNSGSGGNGGGGGTGNKTDGGTTSGTGGSGDTGGSGGATGTGGGGAVECASNGCTESWLCTSWQTSGAASVAGTRTCTDQNTCGTQTCKPSEAVTLPALSLDNYKCNVEPVFDKFCAMLGCHGTEQGRALRIYARGRLRITGETLVRSGGCSAGTTPSANCIGGVECACWTAPHTPTEWQRNFDSARGFLLDSSGKALADVEDSELLQQPLIGGGFAHAGIHFFTKGDADYNAIMNWLGGATTSCTNGNLQN